MRNSRHDAALIEECAQAHSVSVRAVRNWRTKDDPRWREFIRSRAQDATFSFARPEASAKPMTPDEAETAAAIRVSRLSSLCDQAEANGNINSLGTLIKNTTDAHKLWIIAAENNLKLATAAGKLVEVSAVSEFILGNMAMAKQLMENLPDVLSSRIDSSVDVAGITRQEVVAILRELSTASSSAPWISKESSKENHVTGTSAA
jgi:hypothetical protein